MADHDNPVDRSSSGLDLRSFLTDSQNRRTGVADAEALVAHIRIACTSAS